MKEIEVNKLDIDVPAWIEQDIHTTQVESIIQGGCASGAYMPAVTYHSALKTMSEYGDEILDYVEGTGCDFSHKLFADGWSGLACHILSMAVESWALSVESEIEEKLEELEEENSENE